MKPLAVACSLWCLLLAGVSGEDPYRFFDWTITAGTISPLGVPQEVILINGQFPGPEVVCQTNDNLIVNVHNALPEPFLISWNGVQQRKNSWQDGVAGTNCGIPAGANYTYHLQLKDQIGTFFYFPSLALHRAAGGFGAIRVNSRPLIPVPFPPPAADYSLLVGDWYKSGRLALRAILDSGSARLPNPDAILINGRPSGGFAITVGRGMTYRLRISNVGIQCTLNVRIQSHSIKLVEVEGIHTVQNVYSSLDVHVGQSVSVLVTADQPVADYHIAVSTRFTTPALAATAVLHYTSSMAPPSGPMPAAPADDDIDWSMNQARSIRTNLTASGPRPNPQGSYHYGSINVTRTVRLAGSGQMVNGKQRYAVNGVSYVEPDTPLKLADHFKIPGVFVLGGIPDTPPPGGRGPIRLLTPVMAADFHAFTEIVIQNDDGVVQSWHLDGHSMFVVGMERGRWSESSRSRYNRVDAVARSTVQVYRGSWTAVYAALDNVGMWNFRTEYWVRRYLGQQFYLRVYTPEESTRNELPMPDNALRCGHASRAAAVLLSLY